MAWSRESPSKRGYGYAWTKRRDAVMRRDAGLCQPCKRAGRLTAATEVDHIVGKAKGGTDADNNLQAICKTCHEEKTIRENGGGAPRAATGADGWPK